MREPVIVRGKIRHIIGCEARIRLEGMANREALVITNISNPVLTIERLHVEPTPGTFLSASTDKTLVLRHCANLSAQFQGNGKVFLEDVEFVGSVLWKGKDVWARQVTFDYDRDKIINDGGHFWALGLFASKAGTLVRTIHGGKTEILGGQIFSNGGWKTRPLFAIEDSSASFVFSEASYSNSAFETIVSETRGAKTKSLVVRGNEGMSERDLPFHAGGIALPLYTGSPVQ